MLKTRILTALLLVGGFFAALFFLPPVGWAFLSTLIAALAAWEWGGLMRAAGFSRYLPLLLVLGLCLALGGLSGELPADLGFWVYRLSAFFWLLVVPFWFVRRWPLPASPLGAFFGVVTIVPAWLAFIELRQAGNWLLLALLFAVSLADSAAYFAGRAFGRHKLAPKISPGKTWEGAIGGGLAVVLYGVGLHFWWPSAFAASLPAILVAGVALTVISIVGDLFESLLKRQAGLKDSSQILPGHGGVLDRIDSLSSTLPLAALVWFEKPFF